MIEGREPYMSRYPIQNVLETVSVARIRADIRALEGVRHPVTNLQALEDAADDIYDSLQALGYEMDVHLFVEGGREYRNIIASRWGLQHPEQRVMVIAHYDTVAISPGADDNASGVAVLLELARVLKAVPFGRSVQLIAVNLEERGPEEDTDAQVTRGSRALAAHARANRWEIDGVLVFEAVAYAGENIRQEAPAGLPVEMPERGDFIAVVGNEDSASLVQGYVQAVERYQIPLRCLPLVVPSRGEMLPDTRRSDHAPFWDEGYRAIMLTDTANFRNPHYHQASDTLDTLNLAFAANVCRAAAGLVIDMAGWSNQH
jgi:hypothetical protein